LTLIEKAKKKFRFTDSDKGNDEKTTYQTRSNHVEKVKSEQGIMDKIQNFFTGGYGTKEDLRELDKKLRDGYSENFKRMRHRWEEVSLSALKARQSNKDDYKKIIQVMDRVEAKINRADYGYAGMMDRKGSIKEDALGRVFDYDRALGNEITDLEQSIEEIYGMIEAEDWNATQPKVRAVKLSLLDFEKKWDERENQFRPLEL